MVIRIPFHKNVENPPGQIVNPIPESKLYKPSHGGYPTREVKHVDWKSLCIKERSLFEAEHRGLDFSTVENTKWTSSPPHPIYKHPMIKAMWEGWWSKVFSENLRQPTSKGTY